MDRCPKCGGPVTFHAITVVLNRWRRWTDCSACAIFISADAFGGNIEFGPKPPPKNALARNEVIPDEGSYADRYGQDYLRSVPQLQ